MKFPTSSFRMVLALIGMISISGALTAQRLPNNPNASLDQFGNSFRWMRSLISYNPNTIKGSVYLQNPWDSGNVVFINGNVYGKFPLNYDIYHSQIHIKDAERGYMSLETGAIDQFSFFDQSENRERIFRRIANEDINFQPYNIHLKEDRFYEVLFSGKNTLFKLYEKKLAKKDVSTVYANTRLQDEYVERVSYFVRDVNGNFRRIKLSRKHVIKAFPELKDKITELQVQEGLFLGKEEDVIRLIELLEEV